MPSFSVLMDVKNILLYVVAIANIFLAAMICFKSIRGSKITTVYGFNIIAILGWILGMIFFRSAPKEFNELFVKILYIAPTIIASTFLYFTYIFPAEDESEKNQKRALKIFLGNAIVIALVLIPGFVIKSVTAHPGYEKIILFGKGYILYVLYTLFYFSLGFWRLFKKFSKSSGIERQQIVYLNIGYSIAANLAFVTNLIMPWMGKFELNWIGQAFTLFMVVFTTYAILKHHLLNVKIIATEFFAGLIVMTILVELFLSKSAEEIIVRVIILALVSVFAYVLVRGVLKEVRTREEMEMLNKDLAIANEKLKQLDKAKSDFVTIASHQLRTPVTAIKGYSSMLVEGSYGKLSDKVRETVDKIFHSSNRLVFMINDFLNLSRIERGKMQYIFGNADLKTIIHTLTDEFKEVVREQKQKVKISFEAEKNTDFTANIDADKIRQVASNLIDNSIKYGNKEGGEIKILLKRQEKNETFLLEIKDNGIGMSKETLGKIFDKFSRADTTSSQYSDGSGLGLYVGKVIVEAHGGRIWAESKGESKGSSFFIELPIKFTEH